MTDDEYRQAIVDEASTWIRTPYHHAANIKGVGCDCVFLLIEVYSKVGLIEHFDPRPYTSDWFLHRSEEQYLFGMEKRGHLVDTPKKGDIEMFRFGRTASHGAIIVDDNFMIHANRQHGNVELCERRYLDTRHDSYWSVFT